MREWTTLLFQCRRTIESLDLLDLDTLTHTRDTTDSKKFKAVADKMPVLHGGSDSAPLPLPVAIDRVSNN